MSGPGRNPLVREVEEEDVVIKGSTHESIIFLEGIDIGKLAGMPINDLDHLILRHKLEIGLADGHTLCSCPLFGIFEIDFISGNVFSIKCEKCLECMNCRCTEKCDVCRHYFDCRKKQKQAALEVLMRKEVHIVHKNGILCPQKGFVPINSNYPAGEICPKDKGGCGAMIGDAIMTGQNYFIECHEAVVDKKTLQQIKGGGQSEHCERVAAT